MLLTLSVSLLCVSCSLAAVCFGAAACVLALSAEFCSQPHTSDLLCANHCHCLWCVLYQPARLCSLQQNEEPHNPHISVYSYLHAWVQGRLSTHHTNICIHIQFGLHACASCITVGLHLAAAAVAFRICVLSCVNVLTLLLLSLRRQAVGHL